MTREEIDRKKQMIMEFLASKSYRPMSLKEMGVVLQVPAAQKKDFRRVISELSDEGKLQINLKGKVKLMSDNVKTGKYMGTQRGFGFVRVEGEDEDIYISSHKTKGAIDGDTVQVAIDDRKAGRRREGEITAILERGVEIVVGTYSKSKSFGFVIADNQKLGRDIYIPKAESKGAVTGHKVVVEITDYGNGSVNPEGRVIEIIGHVNDPGVDILSVIKAYGLPEEYPDEVLDEVENIEDEVAEEEKEGRTDYRSLQTVTIDGEDAKDLDDAITLTKEGDIYHLGVHIADVSHYVKENSPLDKEALKRGTSVYLVDRVIPMLPHKLSNGICSLNQGVDRLALSCMMDINPAGEIVGHRIEETVINVDRRMSYTSVNKIVELKDEEETEKYKELVQMFELMYELADILRTRRFKKGSIDFDFPECKIILDERGKPIDIREYERNNAHRIIEEFMLAANQTVAEEYYWQELPFVYRVHEEPDSEKIMQLGIFVNNFGHTIKTGSNDEIHPKEIQKLINSVKDKPEEALVSRLALRSMKQAKYTVSCEGHFGLAMKYYCHFTSPIRRYPDLQIHRIIKENMHGKLADKRIEHYKKILPEVSEASSSLERRADESEREVEKMKKAEYMEQFIGYSFNGIISGVTTWGMYVELPNTVEGMVKVADIPGDYFYFDEEHYNMVGEHTGRTYKLGEPIRITVSSVDKLVKTIDFVIADEDTDIDSGEDNDTGKDIYADINKDGKKDIKEVIDGKKDISDADKRRHDNVDIVKPVNKKLSKKQQVKLKKAEGKDNARKKKSVNGSLKRQSLADRKQVRAKSVKEMRLAAEKAFEKKVSAKRAAELVAEEARKLTFAAKTKKKVKANSSTERNARKISAKKVSGKGVTGKSVTGKKKLVSSKNKAVRRSKPKR